MQLDPEILGQIPGVTGEQKAMLLKGEVAETFMKSPAWTLLLDWAESRCNFALAKMKDTSFASPDVQRAFQQLWRMNEDWLAAVQVYFKGLVADRDSVINDLSAAVQDIPVRDMPVVERDSTTPRVEN